MGFLKLMHTTQTSMVLSIKTPPESGTETVLGTNLPSVNITASITVPVEVRRETDDSEIPVVVVLEIEVLVLLLLLLLLLLLPMLLQLSIPKEESLFFP
jgi:hypothetical protein